MGHKEVHKDIYLHLYCHNNATAIKYTLFWKHTHRQKPYLIFVANATYGVSIKIFKWEELFDNECKILNTVSNFTHSVYYYTQCVILHIVFTFTHSV